MKKEVMKNAVQEVAVQEKVLVDIMDFAPAVQYIEKHILMSDTEKNLLEKVKMARQNLTECFLLLCQGDNFKNAPETYIPLYNKALQGLYEMFENNKEGIFKHLHEIIVADVVKISGDVDRFLTDFFVENIDNATESDRWGTFCKYREFKVLHIYQNDDGTITDIKERYCPTLDHLFTLVQNFDNCEIMLKTLIRNVTRYKMTDGTGNIDKSGRYGYVPSAYPHTDEMRNLAKDKEIFSKCQATSISKQFGFILEIMSGGENVRKFSSIGIAHVADRLVKPTINGHSEPRIKTFLQTVESELFFTKDKKLSLSKDVK